MRSWCIEMLILSGQVFMVTGTLQACICTELHTHSVMMKFMSFGPRWSLADSQMQKYNQGLEVSFGGFNQY